MLQGSNHLKSTETLSSTRLTQIWRHLHPLKLKSNLPKAARRQEWSFHFKIQWLLQSDTDKRVYWTVVRGCETANFGEIMQFGFRTRAERCQFMSKYYFPAKVARSCGKGYKQQRCGSFSRVGCSCPTGQIWSAIERTVSGVFAVCRSTRCSTGFYTLYFF